jgi:hypothetical protein
MLGGGDSLARGARSAQFGTGGKSVSQMQWDYMMMTPKKFEKTYGFSKKSYEAALEKAEAKLAKSRKK